MCLVRAQHRERIIRENDNNHSLPVLKRTIGEESGKYISHVANNLKFFAVTKLHKCINFSTNVTF